MQVFDDVIILELQEKEWEEEGRKSPIIRPDTAKEREEGSDKARIPYHFFKVVQIGPNCLKAKVGDRIIPKPPSVETPPMMMIGVWVNGKKETKYILTDKSVAGVE